jgi:hypothetical protein
VLYTISASILIQNRNQCVAACLLYVVTTNPNVHTIDLKFLETGHTQMECDSMHSVIEHSKQKTTICVPSQWDTIVFMARRSKPYTVVPQKHWDFKDYKTIAKLTVTNCQIDITGARVQWRKLKLLRFTKDNPDKILFWYRFDEYLKATKCLYLKRGKSQKARLPVSESKKADLLSRCM